jgi:hypothetical protein
MKTPRFIPIILLVSLALSACVPVVVTTGTAPTPTSNTGSNPQQGQLTEIPTSKAPGETVSPTKAAAAVAVAVKALAAQLAVDASTIQVASVEAVDWPDGCLGAGTPDESCLQVITPGYRILLDANGVSYEIHTDLAGKSVRLVQGPGKSMAEATAVFAARQFLAQTLNVSPGSVTLVSTEATTWPDSCLGVPSGRACIQALTPGYKIVFSAGDKQYEVHTDATGKNAALVPATPFSQMPPLIWQSVDQPCQMVSITPQGASYGPCQGVLTIASFASSDMATHLAELTGTYQSFSSETVVGKVTFNGAGQAVATPAEQRAIAEWARLVFMEEEGGRGGAAWGLAFSWHRAGGIAGFCDDLAVNFDGEAIATSCRGETLKNGGRLNLNADQLARLYAWTDNLQAFEINQANDQAVADGMTVVLNFSGSGMATASQADQQAILSFASEIFLQARQSNG